MAVRVGVIGVGYLGQHHARIYSDLEEVLNSSVLSTAIGKRLIHSRKNTAVQPHCDYRDILDNVDALSIVTPTTSHYAIALDCLRAGKDILIEKPITATFRKLMS